MTVKTTGAELKRFYFDEAFWPEGAWHENEEIEVDGSPLSADVGIEDVPDGAAVKIAGGVVIGLPDFGDDGPSFEGHFKKWRRAQNAVSFVVECDKDKEKAVRAAIRAAGGRIIWAIRKIVWKTGIAAQQLNGDDNAINHANQPQ